MLKMSRVRVKSYKRFDLTSVWLEVRYKKATDKKIEESKTKYFYNFVGKNVRLVNRAVLMLNKHQQLVLQIVSMM